MAVAIWSGPETAEDKEVRRTTRTTILGSEDGSVVRALGSSSKGRGFESGQERRDNKFLQGQLSVLNLTSVSVTPPCYRSCT